MPTAGVISFQGDFERHIRRIEALGCRATGVRDPAQLEELDALVIPGGESTTIGMLLDRFGFMERVRELMDDGLPVMGTCAGAILLSDRIAGVEQPQIRGLHATIRRNAYGRQTESFEATLSVVDRKWSAWSDSPVVGVFIRAPIFQEVAADVDVLMRFEDRPVLVRQGRILAATFHPELTVDPRVHRYFLVEVAGLKLPHAGQ